MVTCPYCGQLTEYLNTKYAAQLLGIQPATLRRWLQAGKFPNAQYVKGIHKTGMWKVPVEDILFYLNGAKYGVSVGDSAEVE